MNPMPRRTTTTTTYSNSRTPLPQNEEPQNEGEKTFLRITNQTIYDEIKLMRKDITGMQTSFVKEHADVRGQMAMITKVGGIVIAILLTLVSAHITRVV